MSINAEFGGCIHTAFMDDGRERIETQIMYPVIRRMPRERGVILHDLVYEPDNSAHSYSYHCKEFSPSSFELWLPDQTSYMVHLPSTITNISRYDYGLRDIHMAPPDTVRDEFSIFSGPARDGPLKVFYNTFKSEWTEDSNKLHAFIHSVFVCTGCDQDRMVMVLAR